MTDPIFAVLVNLNRWSDTVECLESVLRSDYANTRAIVVDNGSTDRSIERFREWASGARAPSPPASDRLKTLSWPPIPKPLDHVTIPLDGDASPPAASLPTVTVLDAGKNLGFAGATNVALRMLLRSERSGYAFLVNNDMIVARDALTRMVERLESDTGLAAVGGVILDYDDPDLVQSIGGGWMSKLWGKAELFGAGLRRDDLRPPPPLGYISGGCLLISFDMLRQVGLLDERYFLYAEDADWGERMRAGGYRLGCELDAITWHKGAQTVVMRSPFQDYYVVRSGLRYVRKHAPLLTGFAWAYSVARYLAPKIIRGQWTRARSVIRAYRDAARAPAQPERH